MATNSKPFVMFELDRERKFRFTLNNLVEFEELTGVSVEGAFGNMSLMRKILWLGFRNEDPELTEEALGDMIDTVPKLFELFEATGPILGIDFGDEDDKLKNVPRAAIPSRKKRKPSQPGTGQPPSSSPTKSA